MKIRKIQKPEGVAIRVDLLPNRGRLSLIFLVTGLGTMAFFPWERFLDPELLELTLLAAFWVVFSMIAFFARHVIQIDPDRQLRKGYNIMGMTIWLGKIALSRIAWLQLIDEDRENPVLGCIDASGVSILAIEGLRDPREAERFAEVIGRQIGDHDTAAREYVKSIEKGPPIEPRRWLSWLLIATAFLFGIVVVLLDSGGGEVSHQLVRFLIAVGIAAIAMYAVLPEEKVTYSNADEGIIHGWVRRNIIWIESYILELKNSPDPFVTGRRFDRGLYVRGTALLAYGLVLFLVISRSTIPSENSVSEDTPPVERSEEELENIRKGAEKLKELLEKRRQESE